MELTSEVRNAAATIFNGQQLADALIALELYGAPEVPRVQLTCLVLCKESIERLFALIDGANGDYRDDLFAAEWPEMSGGPETREQMAERYHSKGVPVPKALQSSPE